MIRKKLLLQRAIELDRELEHVKYATEKITEMLGGILTYYSHTHPTIIGNESPGTIPQRLQAICDHLDIELEYPEVKIKVPRLGVVAVKKKNK